MIRVPLKSAAGGAHAQQQQLSVRDIHQNVRAYVGKQLRAPPGYNIAPA